MNTLLKSQQLSITTVDSSNINLLLSLSLSLEQVNFVEPIFTCLQDAQNDHRYSPVALYFKDDLCGFAMYGLFEENNEKRVWFDRFLIGIDHQGNGLGKRFAQLMMTFLMNTYQVDSLYLSVYDNNLVAIKLYQQLGFIFNGEIDVNGEKVMVYKNRL